MAGGGFGNGFDPIGGEFAEDPGYEWSDVPEDATDVWADPLAPVPQVDPNHGFGFDVGPVPTVPEDQLPGFGDHIEPDAPLLLDLDGVGRVFSDEGGDIVTIANLPLQQITPAQVRWKFRVEHVATKTLFPKVGFCYSTIQGSADVCSPVLGGLLQFALPPCLLGVYRVHIYVCYLGDTANAQYAETLDDALYVDRRVRDLPTYRGRRRLPLRYLTGPVGVGSEAKYPAEV